ncbi:MAG TPA: universal stress protein [Xanthobacteraceae bacterium]|jgi:nucleotide-binding universal stress UspA family protein
MSLSIRAILHPTDFSDLSGAAFAHALCIALAAGSRLQVLHVLPHDPAGALAFPHGRRLLAQWELIDEDDHPGEIADKLGIEIEDVRLVAQQPVGGIVGFLRRHSCDLIVLATEGGDGLARWLKGSVAETVSRRAAVPVLFVAQGARSFVDQVSGDARFRRVLVPIDLSPPPDEAIEVVQCFGTLMTGADVAMHLLHVGASAPRLRMTASKGGGLPPVMVRSGSVVQTIIDTAVELDVDLVAMPTAGHRGVLDVLRGSTTERVIRHAPCPVLALPSGWRPAPV